jgi:hypothetical protein
MHPLSHPDLLADRGVTQSGRTDIAGDHLTGVESNAQAQIDTVAAVSLRGDKCDCVLDAQRSQAGAQRVVFQRGRCAEYRHDAVASELIHCPTKTLHNGRRAGDELGHDLA